MILFRATFSGFLLLACCPGFLWASAPSPKVPLRILLPNTDYTLAAQREFNALVAEFEKSHPGTPVTVIRRGEEYSTLRELIAMQLAGDLPEIAAIECGEFPAIASMKLAAGPLLPFERTAPVLVANEEVLFRVNVRTLPKTWDELSSLARKLADQNPESGDSYALALPLQGTRGLWFFEELANKPLWNREAGGLRTNRDLIKPIETLQKLLDVPRAARADEHLDRALPDFLEGKVPLLVASLDLLPTIASRVKFRWTAGPLPSLDSTPSRPTPTQLCGGNNLIVTRSTPEVREFVDFLYRPEIAARWSRSMGVIPLQPGWTRTREWQGRPFPQYEAVLPHLKFSGQRSTDVDVVRARSSWVQALRLLFDDASRRLAPESVFLQLDRILSRK